MLLETLPFEIAAPTVQLIFALALGMAFGAAAQISKFCLRRSVASEDGADQSAAAVWITALGFAVVGFALAKTFGFVDTGDHRLMNQSLPLLAIALGGLAFGAGMVLTRGCVSRLTVLSATGNLRAVSSLIIFAIVAHATQKGVLAPVRTALSEATVETPLAALSDIAGLPFVIGAILILVAARLAQKTGTGISNLALGAVIGLIAVLSWAGTSVLLLDDFDPLPVQSIAFTLPWSDSLFWTLASSSITAGFGVGFIGGVLGGSFASAALRGELEWQSFSAPSETLRYSAGAALMGVGGVLAGGCTVGAGLSGGAMLSVAALVALAFIIFGAVAMRLILQTRILDAKAMA